VAKRKESPVSWMKRQGKSQSLGQPLALDSSKKKTTLPKCFLRWSANEGYYSTENDMGCSPGPCDLSCWMKRRGIVRGWSMKTLAKLVAHDQKPAV
jgi:hypothetical protein